MQVFSGFAVRHLVVVVGLILLSQQQWERFLAALAGFMLLKIMLIAFQDGPVP